MKTLPVGAELFHAGGRTGGLIDMTKPIVAFRNFTNATKNRTLRKQNKNNKYNNNKNNNNNNNIIIIIIIIIIIVVVFFLYD
jgi:hypothetical protein